ncbi:hypothetical protein A1O1_07400 [Capronia coronata CBS 617.96]|uniref:Dystroglycan-type cadherin-like domain-containing protein n=1 Tax=Capronia coronata CBS 617.96 TaxID=1182541 RepID=W9XU60_9EURO|nr:uncharacterized protein A1O1_07400 [Capronia coronata CBS 617.96]EXJ83773.1 hypothetical protein A1O1_07400 [Capronia coronata CBS 617.96]
MPVIERRKPFLACFLGFLARYAAAAPDLVFPFDAQLPPVAYVSQPYGFTFSVATFVSDGPSISYTLRNRPHWLLFDGDSRRFRGTPTEKDVGVNNFELTASDHTGEVSTNVTLVVLESINLQPDRPVLPQLQRAGQASSPESLLLRPLQRFSLPFDHNTFSGIDQNTHYYAVSADKSPLPSWIQFDPTLLLFTGVSPPLTSPSTSPQTFGVLLIASNVPGFAELAVRFDIIVGGHILAFSTPCQVYGISEGVAFQTPPFRSLLQLDDRAVRDEQIASIHVDGPGWINLDKGQVSLNGTAAPSPSNTNVTISVIDIYDDVANLTIFLREQASPVMALGTIVDFNVTIGEYFSHPLTSASFSPSAGTSIYLDQAAGWLHIDPSSWLLSGQPPGDLSQSDVNVTVTLQNATTTATGVIGLHLIQLTPTASLQVTGIMETATSPVASQTSHSSDLSGSAKTKGMSRRHVVAMILAIVLPILAVLVAICLILYLMRMRRRSRDTPVASDELRTVHTREGSLGLESSVLKGPSQYIPGDSTEPGQIPVVPGPPKIDFSWSNDSLGQSKLRMSAIEQPAEGRHSTVSRADSLVHPTVLTARSDANRSHTLGERPTAREFVMESPAGESETFRNVPERVSCLSTLHNMQQIEARLPTRKSGAGHGAGIAIQSDLAANGDPWRATWLSNPASETRRSTVVLESFPIPPRDAPGQDAIGSPREFSSYLDDDMSFEARRQKWHTERARARLEGMTRFSNAGASRLTPSPRPRRTGSRNPRELTARSATVMEDITNNGDNRCRKQSWQNWVESKRGAHDVQTPLEVPLEVGHMPGLREKPSITSSRQFDSLPSSRSQWDPEDCILEQAEAQDSEWESDDSVAAWPQDMSGQSPYLRRLDRRDRGQARVDGFEQAQSSQDGSSRFI